ncbi:hypothetical protein [Streptomyces sp. BH105]|uniref:hypothetical protein n=1 Tax=Streptomyces sp. BH105 TaxID=3410408 RepID=UPI003CEAF854
MSNFWSKHLGAPAPAYQPPAMMQQPVHYPQPAEPPAPRQAAHARESTACPECQGSNYFAVPTEPRAGKRCYECGFPKLHSTSGLSIKSEGKATPARQTLANKNGGFSMTVVGRLG